MKATTTFLYQVWPYLAAIVFAAGLALRALLTRGSVPALRRTLSEAVAPVRGDRFLRVTIALLAAGHLVALLFPRAVMSWNAVAWRLYALEAVAFVLGVAALAAWGRAIWRHVSRTGAPLLGELADSALLSLLFVSIISGLLTAVVYRWASSWSVATLTPYAASLLRGNPALVLVDRMPFLVHVHVFAAFGALAVLPFSRPGLVLVVALHRALGAAARPLVAAESAAESWLRRHSPAGWLWPEPEYRWIAKPVAAGEGVPPGEAAQRARRRRESEGVVLAESGSKI